jgi:DNA-binding transcriptional regulator GbsR (MarR family)
MELNTARDRFIQAWGALGTSWGINRTMAQVQALLLISPDPLSADEIMAQLNISRGNANMNIRALIDWGLVQKMYQPGERKEFFSSEKDIWQVAIKVMRERRKRELEPLIGVLAELKDVKGKETAQLAEFNKVIADIDNFAARADGILLKLEKMNQNWFMTKFMKLFG